MASMLGTQSSSMNSSGSYNQTIPKFSQDALTKLFGEAAKMFSSQQASTAKLTPAVQKKINQQTNAANNAWKNMLGGGIFKGMNPNSVLNTIKGFQSTPSQTSDLYANIMGGKGNDYVDAMKGTLMKDAERARDLNMAQLDTRATGSGMSGGSRHGVAQALMDQDINRNLQDSMAKLGYESFDKDLNNKLSIARQADSNQLARENMFTSTGTNFINSKNANMSGGLSYSPNMQNLSMGMFAPSMMPWSNLQNYASAIGNPIILNSGSQSSNSYSGK